MLVSVAQQDDSAICIYMHIPFILFHYGSSQGIGYSALRSTAGPCLLLQAVSCNVIFVALGEETLAGGRRSVI